MHNTGFIRTKPTKPGRPIPAGKVRVYKADEDQSQVFLGEDRIDNTPKDEKIRLYMGDAFDVVEERKQISYKQLSDRYREETWHIKLRNHKDTQISKRIVSFTNCEKN